MIPEQKTSTSAGGDHPAMEELQRFMTGGVSRLEARAVVRHLLRGCPACIRETGRLWNLGGERPATQLEGVWK